MPTYSLPKGITAKYIGVKTNGTAVAIAIVIKYRSMIRSISALATRNHLVVKNASVRSAHWAEHRIAAKRVRCARTAHYDAITTDPMTIVL